MSIDRKIYFIDQTSEYDHHMVFNASMLKILLHLFPEQALTHIGIATNQQSVQQLLSPEEKASVRFSEINNPKIQSSSIFLKSMNYARKEQIRFGTFREILKKANANDVIFLSITTFTSFLLFKYLKAFYSTKVIAVLHGDIDFIYFPAGKFSKWNAWSHKKIFKKKLPDFKYLLLNKIAKKHLVKDGYLKENEVFEIDHPFTFLNDENGSKDIHQCKPIKIGHIGSMEVERKGSHHIYELAENFKSDIEENKIQFRVAGLITPGIIPYRNKWVKEVVGDEKQGIPPYLTRTQYEYELSLLDYCIFFYPQNEYIFRASGAVVDFISRKIPIITLKHPYFEYLFSVAGDIGFMCDSLEDMKILIKKIADRDPEILNRYRLQQNNIEKLKDKFSIKFVAGDLKHQAASYLNL